MTSVTVIHIRIEGVVWQPGDEWRGAISSLADRFQRVSPLDTEVVFALGSLTAQMEYLADWSSAANIDLDRELGRYLDEHLSMFVRPQPAITRVIRSLAASHQLVGVSVLPPRAVESICRHTGVWRSLATVIANGASAPQDAAVISTVSELEASLVAS